VEKVQVVMVLRRGTAVLVVAALRTQAILLAQEHLDKDLQGVPEMALAPQAVEVAAQTQQGLSPAELPLAAQVALAWLQQ
jgi:hypothetical protein